jgi:hypothetical protein
MSSLKVIDIRLYSLLSLSPITFPSTLSLLLLPQRYSTYSVMPSLPLLFYSHSSYVVVINFTLYCYYPFNPFTSSLFHPLAYIGCWWDLRRDPFIFLSSHYTCPWCIPGFVWCLYYQQVVSTCLANCFSIAWNHLMSIAKVSTVCWVFQRGIRVVGVNQRSIASPAFGLFVLLFYTHQCPRRKCSTVRATSLSQGDNIYLGLAKGNTKLIYTWW